MAKPPQLSYTNIIYYVFILSNKVCLQKHLSQLLNKLERLSYSAAITTFILTGPTGEISGITSIITWGLYNIHMTVSSLAFSKPKPLVSINQNLASKSSPTR